jgi:hypothetical protein
VSRGRKAKKKPPSRSPRVLRAVAPAECDCPACTGDPVAALAEIVEEAGEFVVAEDPLEAQLVGAMFAAMEAAAVAEGAETSLVGAFIARLEAQATAKALALLAAIGSVVPDPVGKDATDAADRLAAAGVSGPPWVAELRRPVTVSDCVRLADRYGNTWALGCRVHRAGRSYALMVDVEPNECGEAAEIELTDAENWPMVIASVKDFAREHPGGVRLREAPLEPADFRWEVEKALDARAAHDAEAPDTPREPGDLGGPPFEAVAPVLLSWLAYLPDPGRPPARHDDSPRVDLGPFASPLAALAPSGTPLGLLGRAVPAKLPAKRKKSDGPAPLYVVKVALRGTKPPIWRRLEVPGDLPLGRLHRAIQVAFGWQDYHLHVFETPYGDFGVADPELGYRAEGPVTLEQVAPGAGAKISYTYDFGDGWEHAITVEKLLDPPADGKAGILVTGGRRAGPPEDCGGVWGYAELVEILRDPSHPDHGHKLEWLGLDDAEDFDPAAFDLDGINEELAALR